MRPPGAQDRYSAVLSGKLEVRKVLETERVLAFHRTRPLFSYLHLHVGAGERQQSVPMPR